MAVASRGAVAMTGPEVGARSVAPSKRQKAAHSFARAVARRRHSRWGAFVCTGRRAVACAAGCGRAPRSKCRRARARPGSGSGGCGFGCGFGFRPALAFALSLALMYQHAHEMAPVAPPQEAVVVSCGGAGWRRRLRRRGRGAWRWRCRPAARRPAAWHGVRCLPPCWSRSPLGIYGAGFVGGKSSW